MVEVALKVTEEVEVNLSGDGNEKVRFNEERPWSTTQVLGGPDNNPTELTSFAENKSENCVESQVIGVWNNTRVMANGVEVTEVKDLFVKTVPG